MPTNFTLNRTFRDAGLIPNDPDRALANLVFLNTALQEQAGLAPGKEGGTGAIFGLAEDYYIAQPEMGQVGASAIFLNSNNHVICLPGCRIIRAKDFDSKSTGVVRGGTKTARITNARWIGGEFVSEKNAAGEYASGHVFRIIGDDILIEDVTINGFGAPDTVDPDGKINRNGGIAMALLGDRIRVVNPKVINPFAENGAGIRVFGGTGFRCVGGEVASGGDAALQFSTGPLDGAASPGVFDGAYLGTRCTRTGCSWLTATTGEAVAGRPEHAY